MESKLEQVINILNSIEVKGQGNLGLMYTAIDTLSKMVVDLREVPGEPSKTE